jgi:hypothetical protein
MVSGLDVTERVKQQGRLESGYHHLDLAFQWASFSKPMFYVFDD